MGKQILSKDLVEAPIKGAERLIEKVPAINKLYEGTRKHLSHFMRLKNYQLQYLQRRRICLHFIQKQLGQNKGKH